MNYDFYSLNLRRFKSRRLTYNIDVIHWLFGIPTVISSMAAKYPTEILYSSINQRIPFYLAIKFESFDSVEIKFVYLAINNKKNIKTHTGWIYRSTVWSVGLTQEESSSCQQSTAIWTWPSRLTKFNQSLIIQSNNSQEKHKFISALKMPNL